MVEGKVSNLGVVRAPRTATVPEPQEDKAVVFVVFFYSGLQIPSVDLVVEVLKLYGVKLAQLTPNSVVWLSVFEWVLRSCGAEVITNLLVYLHDVKCP